MNEMKYIYHWGNNPKRATMKGRICKIVTSGKLCSVLIEFCDGQKEITSRRSLRKLKKAGPCALALLWSDLKKYIIGATIPKELVIVP